ncbi:hypothetical protein [Haloarcula marina]|uniref:hypothetical protein n=1 Tax=Haloarcula marina TaxID=2961574 RepID=UPI0020B7B343|nr:hypothetical protein [Halomicroarcula marina]
MTTVTTSPLNKVGVVSTLVDAALAFVRGREKSGLFLLGAAALSSRIPGIGVVASVLLRLIRWLR